MKKTALGFGLAVACLYCVLLVSVLGRNDFFQENNLLVSLWLAGAGLSCVVAGAVVMALRRRWARRHRQAVDEVIPLLSLRFWGMILLIFAVLTQLFALLPELRQRAAHLPLLSGWRVTKPVETAAPAPGPALRLQGILIEPGHRAPAAIINGRIVRVGEAIGDARVLDIRRYGVLVRQGDETWLLEIRDWTQVRVKPATNEVGGRKS